MAERDVHNDAAVDAESGSPERERDFYDNGGYVKLPLLGRFGHAAARLARWHPLALYSLGFVVVAALSFATLAWCGKGFINYTDGVSQQFNSFAWTGMAVRGAIRELLAGGGWSLPVYDLSEGYGAAVRWSTDPLVYLSVLFPEDLLEAGFHLVVVLRLWLCGAAFLLLARRLAARRRIAWGAWTAVAALCYAFSSFGLQSVMQTTFLNHAILFPLIVGGAIALMDEGRPLAFIAATAAAVYVSGIYIVFMMMVMTALLVAAVLLVRREPPRAWLVDLARFLPSIAAALAIAAPVAVPSVLSLGTNDRVSAAFEVPLLYSPGYYFDMFAGFLGLYWGERDWFFGYGALALVCAAAVFAMGKSALAPEHAETLSIIRALFVAMAVIALIPELGSLLNGGAYAANRWIWAFGLLVAVIIAFIGPRLASIAPIELARLAGLVALYTVGLLLFAQQKHGAALEQLVVAWVLVALMAAASGPWSLRLAGAAAPWMALASLAALCLNYHWFLSPDGADWQANLVPLGQAMYAAADGSPARMAADEGACEGLYRTDSSNELRWYMTGIGVQSDRLLGVYGADYYSSLYDAGVSDLHDELALAGTATPNVYTSLAGRSPLMQALGFGSYALRTDDSSPVPYALDGEEVASMEARDGGDYELHAIDGAAPIAQVRSGVIGRGDYEEMTPLERQEALLQGAVVDSAAADALGAPALELSLAAPAGRETYLYLEGLSLEAPQGDPSWSLPSSANIAVESDAASTNLNIMTPANHLYGGREDWLVNLGWSGEPLTRITLTFDAAGLYSFDELSLWSQPMDTLDAAKEFASRNPVSDMSFDGRAVSGSVSAESDSVLVLSVPYDAGWSATLDGEPVEIVRADTAFMAIALPAGTHEFEFTYSPDGPVLWAVGGCTLAVCLGACAACDRVWRRAAGDIRLHRSSDAA